MNIDTTNMHPVYAYNALGKKHRVPFEVVQWLQEELNDARRYQKQFNEHAEATEYDDYENEIQRHEQDGYVYAIERVLQYVMGVVNE